MFNQHIGLTPKPVFGFNWNYPTLRKTYPTPKRVHSKKAWKKRGKK